MASLVFSIDEIERSSYHSTSATYVTSIAFMDGQFWCAMPMTPDVRYGPESGRPVRASVSVAAVRASVSVATGQFWTWPSLIRGHASARRLADLSGSR
jgi:hypothetical protein